MRKRSVLWLAAPVLLIALLGAWLMFGPTTVQLNHSGGFISSSFGSVGKLRPVAPDRYERLLARYVKGDLFDSLWVSHQDGDRAGIVLSHESGQTQIDVDFLPLKESEKIAAFRKRMAEWGHHPSDESHGNVGMGAEMETLTISYRVPTGMKTLLPVIDRVLNECDGPRGESVFVHPFNLRDMPMSNGLHFRKHRDYLAEVP